MAIILLKKERRIFFFAFTERMSPDKTCFLIELIRFTITFKPIFMLKLAMRLLLAEVLAAEGFASGDMLFCSVIFCFFVRWGVGLTQIERIYMMLSSGCG